MYRAAREHGCRSGKEIVAEWWGKLLFSNLIELWGGRAAGPDLIEVPT
jgi:hypothetical protein